MGARCRVLLASILLDGSGFIVCGVHHTLPEHPLGAFLPLDVGEIGQVAGAVVHAGFRPRQNLRAAEMIGHGDQAARRQNVDIGPGPRRLRAAGMGADQPAPFGIGADRRRQRAGRGQGGGGAALGEPCPPASAVLGQQSVNTN